jgi:hypothetical protein
MRRRHKPQRRCSRRNGALHSLGSAAYRLAPALRRA